MVRFVPNGQLFAACVVVLGAATFWTAGRSDIAYVAAYKAATWGRAATVAF